MERVRMVEKNPPIPVLGAIDPGVNWAAAVLFSDGTVKVTERKLRGKSLCDRLVHVRLEAVLLPRCPIWVVEKPWPPGSGRQWSRRSMIHLSVVAGAFAGALSGFVDMPEPYIWNAQGKGKEAAEKLLAKLGQKLGPDGVSALGVLLWYMTAGEQSPEPWNWPEIKKLERTR